MSGPARDFSGTMRAVPTMFGPLEVVTVPTWPRGSFAIDVIDAFRMRRSLGGIYLRSRYDAADGPVTIGTT